MPSHAGHMAERFTELRSYDGINSPADLSGLSVCSYPQTFQKALAGISLVRTNANVLAECVDRFANGELDALVFDSTTLTHWRANDPWASERGLAISHEVDKFTVAAVVREDFDTQLAERLNVAILEFAHSPAYAEHYSKWFPAGAPQLQEGRHGLRGPANPPACCA